MPVTSRQTRLGGTSRPAHRFFFNSLTWLDLPAHGVTWEHVTTFSAGEQTDYQPMDAGKKKTKTTLV
jgi:hypothetical protein